MANETEFRSSPDREVGRYLENSVVINNRNAFQSSPDREVGRYSRA